MMEEKCTKRHTVNNTKEQNLWKQRIIYVDGIAEPNPTFTGKQRRRPCEEETVPVIVGGRKILLEGIH